MDEERRQQLFYDWDYNRLKPGRVGFATAYRLLRVERRYIVECQRLLEKYGEFGMMIAMERDRLIKSLGTRTSAVCSGRLFEAVMVAYQGGHCRY